jgi:dTDP-4-dehydrorhamnose 3,5-epimerase
MTPKLDVRDAQGGNAEIPDVRILIPRRFGDDRGSFREGWNRRDFEAVMGFDVAFGQLNEARNQLVGTLRGLHFQKEPHPQTKLVWAVTGSAIDLVVDLREGSPTRGKFVWEELTADNGKRIFVPPGFAHGYCTLEPDTTVCYLVAGQYAPETEDGLRWNDPALDLKPWADKVDPDLVNARDREWPLFQA